MPRDGYPCACRPGDWPYPAKCAHHAERDRLEAERDAQGPRERDYHSAAEYHHAFRRWKG